MGNYITTDDLLDVMSAEDKAQLTGDVVADGVRQEREQAITEAIAAAEAEIDGYLGNSYRVPLTDPPAQIKAWAKLLAKRLLLHRRSSVPPDLADECDRILRQLRDVGRGVIKLPGFINQTNIDSVTEPSKSIGHAETTGGDIRGNM